MLKKASTLLFIVFLCLNINIAYSQEIWKGAEYGMSRADVEKLFGKKLYPGNIPKPKPDLDYYSPYKMREDTCGGYVMIHFKFSIEDKLKSIFIAGQGVDGSCFIEQVKAMYGKPVEDETFEADGGGHGRKVVFHKDQIELSVLTGTTKVGINTFEFVSGTTKIIHEKK